MQISKVVYFIIFLFSFNCFANESRIVATIGSKNIITTEDVTKRARVIAATSGLPQDQLEANERKIFETALKSLIREKIIADDAKKYGIIATEQDAQNSIANIAKANNTTSANIYAQLSGFGVSKSDINDFFKGNIIWEKLKWQVIIRQINNSNTEILDYLEIKSPDKVLIDYTQIISSSKQELEKLKSGPSSKICSKELPKTFVANKFVKKFSEITDKNLAALLKNMQTGQTTIITNEAEKFSMLVICNKKHVLSHDELDEVKQQMQFKKIDIQADYYLKQLYKKKHVNILAGS